jgi:Phage integrase, N-terminal SAM-like domain
MVSSRDTEIIELWLAKQASPHTRSCYRRDVERILSYSIKSLKDITLADLPRFGQSLVDAGLAPISRARTLAAIKSLFSFCQRVRYIPSNPAAELALPNYENRLRSGSSANRKSNGCWKLLREHETAFSWPCYTPRACGFPKRADCSGGTCVRAAPPAKSPCSARTDGRAQLP